MDTNDQGLPRTTSPMQLLTELRPTLGLGLFLCLAWSIGINALRVFFVCSPPHYLGSSVPVPVYGYAFAVAAYWGVAAYVLDHRKEGRYGVAWTVIILSVLLPLALTGLMMFGDDFDYHAP